MWSNATNASPFSPCASPATSQESRGASHRGRWWQITGNVVLPCKMPEQTGNLNAKGSRNVYDWLKTKDHLCHKDKCEECLEKRYKAQGVCPLFHILTINKFTLGKRTYIYSVNGCSSTICPGSCSDSEDKAWAWYFCPKACILKELSG